MEDLNCCKCGVSIALSEHPGVFRCGHMCCGNCGLGVECPLDYSQCVWDKEDIARAIGEVRAAYNHAIRQNDPEWAPYYTAVTHLKELILLKDPQYDTNSSLQQPLSSSLPQSCPHCHVPMSGQCLRCESFPASFSQTWKCSICSAINKESDLLCEICSGHRHLEAEKKGKYWKCRNCQYKYNSQTLPQCANCHNSK